MQLAENFSRVNCGAVLATTLAVAILGGTLNAAHGEIFLSNRI